MKQTNNYGLVKPSESDYFNIEDFNGNTDIIDAELKRNSDSIALLENNSYNPNLLINSNFKVSAIVNQRGKTVYSTNINGWTKCIDMLEYYAIDTGHYISLENNYVRLVTVEGEYTCIRQKVEHVQKGMLTATVKFKATAGEKIAFSIKPSIKTVYIIATGDWQTVSVTGELLEDSTVLNIDLWFYKVAGNGICDIEYMKLEYGSVATKFVDDDATTKLDKCLRYLQKITIPQSPLIADNGNQVFIPIDFQQKMRLDTVVATLTSVMVIHGITSSSVQQFGQIGDTLYVYVDKSTIEFNSLNTLFTTNYGSLYVINSSTLLGNYASFPATLLLSAEL